MRLSIIVPAFNEEAWLPATLDAIEAAATRLLDRADGSVEMIVVDNNSTDRTAAVALQHGAVVIHEPQQGIARSRNAGARHARGEVLVFVDADVIVPPSLLEAIHAVLSDPACLGGAVDVEYRPRRRLARLYLRAWRALAGLSGMAQGATQFCRASVFEELGGYDEGAWIGEDVDFFWSLKRLAGSTGRKAAFIRKPRVRPSTRRFDQWPLWRTLLWTNPLVIALLRRWKAPWRGWYARPVR